MSLKIHLNHRFLLLTILIHFKNFNLFITLTLGYLIISLKRLCYYAEYLALAGFYHHLHSFHL